MKTVFSLSLLVVLLGCTRPSGRSGGDTVRVLTYNIHHANPPSKPEFIDLEAIARVIKNDQPDIVMVQEVDVRTRRSGQVDEAEKLAQLTGLQAYFVKAIDHDGGEYGVALLSKFPLHNQRRYPLPLDSQKPGEPRVLGTAELKLPSGRSITVACTHLDAQRGPASRVLQAKEIARILKAVPMPVILAGDLNDTPESETLRILNQSLQSTCKDCAPTIPVENPRKTIDFILTGGPWKVMEHRVIQETYASDHLPVRATLSLP
ncbi:endonuclease [Siphonobacter sp. BAB-5405]|uniref:endonuclease/exonuclease/phosphatase family protein n=1 Tax=Siphonobacter sp. BAB-5405 TaxID=1864825 RepID=UPI000C8082FC|nr:endonuclease/exonuclease/phosphatase family protein [Siphonobacter sp. BAB-5405]PMD95012.1 endonuclease [Siphonobacter sp. BAB-5405]